MSAVSKWSRVKASGVASGRVRVVSEEAPALSGVYLGAVTSGYGATTDRARIWAARHDEFASWRGKRVQIASDFCDLASWSGIEGWSQSIVNGWNYFPGDVAFSLAVPMLPTDDVSTTLALGATGAYDSHYTTLATRVVAAGLGGRTIYRIGWEMNGDWYRWAVRNPTDAASYVAYWRRIADAIRAIDPSSKFWWNPNWNGWVVDPMSAYPGDAYVDWVGPDFYLPDGTWTALKDGQYGLTWWRDLASTHGKKVGIAEWGMRTGTDSDTFVSDLYAWCAETESLGLMAAELYFCSAEYSIYPTTTHPLAAAEYRLTFGGQLLGWEPGAVDPAGRVGAGIIRPFPTTVITTWTGAADPDGVIRDKIINTNTAPPLGTRAENCVLGGPASWSAGSNPYLLSGVNGTFENPIVAEWCTLRPQVNSAYANGIGPRNVVARFCDIYNVTDGVRASAPGDGVANIRVESSWFHDVVREAPDYATGNRPETHNDVGIQLDGNSAGPGDVVFDGVHIDARYTQSLGAFPTDGLVHNLTCVMFSPVTQPGAALTIRNSWLTGSASLCGVNAGAADANCELVMENVIMQPRGDGISTGPLYSLLLDSTMPRTLTNVRYPDGSAAVVTTG